MRDREGDTVTADNITPADRARVALEDAIADAYRQGEQKGRMDVIAILTDVLDATEGPWRDNALSVAKRKLKEWGV